MGARYEIRVRGRMSRTLMSEFEDLHLEAVIEPIETILHGPVQDQAALHGLLRRVELLGLELVEVRRLPPGKGDAATPEQRRGVQSSSS